MLTVTDIGNKLNLIPSLAYLFFTLILWSLYVAYDVLVYKPESWHSGDPSEGIILTYVGSQVLGAVQYILLYFYFCQPQLRHQFCWLVLKGGLASCLVSMFPNTACAWLGMLFGVDFPSTPTSNHLVHFLVTVICACNEEIAKLGTLLLTVKAQTMIIPPGYWSVSTRWDWFTLASAVGLGFQVWENHLYFSRAIHGGASIAVLIFMGLVRTLLLAHPVWVDLSALNIWDNCTSKGQRPSIKQFMVAILLSTSMHTTWNTVCIYFAEGVTLYALMSAVVVSNYSLLVYRIRTKN